MLFMFENFIMFSIMNITLSKPKHESRDDYFDLLSRTNNVYTEMNVLGLLYIHIRKDIYN